MPKRPKPFIDHDARRRMADERKIHLEHLPQVKWPRFMEEFSEAELAEIQAKLESWTRKPTGDYQS